jgi:hypothetical protein
MFCSSCGADLPNSARFCERCGHSVEPDASTPASAKRSFGGIDRRLIGGVVAAAVVAIAVAVLVLVGAFERDDAEKTSARPTASPTAPTPTPATPPTVASPDLETTAQAPEQPARATVQGTCGRNGVGGDCVLSVRAQPSASAAELDRLGEGDSLTLTCQVRGERVYSSALGASSTVWSRTAPRGYVANVYVDGPRLSPRRITLPRC